jgi:hypothetical protein
MSNMSIQQQTTWVIQLHWGWTTELWESWYSGEKTTVLILVIYLLYYECTVNCLGELQGNEYHERSVSYLGTWVNYRVMNVVSVSLPGWTTEWWVWWVHHYQGELQGDEYGECIITWVNYREMTMVRVSLPGWTTGWWVWWVYHYQGELQGDDYGECIITWVDYRVMVSVSLPGWTTGWWIWWVYHYQGELQGDEYCECIITWVNYRVMSKVSMVG